MKLKQVIALAFNKIVTRAGENQMCLRRTLNPHYNVVTKLPNYTFPQLQTHLKNPISVVIKKILISVLMDSMMMMISLFMIIPPREILKLVHGFQIKKQLQEISHFTTGDGHQDA